jgi:hypothetical protein
VKRTVVTWAAASLALVLTAIAPPAQADQTVTLNIDLADNCRTTPDGGSLSLQPGETLTVRLVAVNNYPDATYRCRGILTAGSNPLTGWVTSGGTSLDGFTNSVTNPPLPGPGTLTLSFTVGTVSAAYLVGRFTGGTYVDYDRPGGALFFLNVIRGPVTQGPGAPLPPVEHQLGFDANGGFCNLTNSGPIVDGVWIQVPTAEQCTRPGYTLLGWNPKPDGSDPLGFDPGGWTVMTGDNVLYAIWVPVR